MTDPRLDYVIEIANADGFALGELREWNYLTFTQIMCEVGAGQVDCRASDFNRRLVGDGAGLQVFVWRAGKVRSSGAFTVAGERVDLQSGTIQLTWSDKNAVLANEPAYPNPETETGQGTRSHDSRIGHTSTVVRDFVNANVGPAARPERRAAAFSVGPDPAAGEYLQAPVAARWDNLLELIRGVALPNGVVFEVVTEDRQHTFITRQARDLSGQVQFSRALNNLGPGEFSIKSPEATRVLVLGPYEGTARMSFLVPDASESVASERRWRGRKLFVLDAPSIVKADESVYAAQVAAAQAAKVAADAADDYAKFTYKLATDAEKKAVDWAEDADLSQAEKDQAAKEARAAGLTAREAADNYVTVYAALVAAQAAEDEAVERADRETTIHALYAQANRLLGEKGETVEAAFEILEGTFSLGVDFHLGDFVAVIPDGYAGGFVKPVREYTESVSTSGRKTSVVVGDYTATSGTAAQLRSDELLSTVRRLQTR